MVRADVEKTFLNAETHSPDGSGYPTAGDG